MLILIGQYKTCADFQGKPGNFMAADTQINDDKWKLFTYPVSVIGADMSGVCWRLIIN